MTHAAIPPSSPSRLHARIPVLGAGLGLLAGLGAGMLQGCDEDSSPAERIAEQCGLDIECEAGGILEGNAHVSGIASIDTFFGAVIDVEAKAGRVEGTIRGELDAIAASVGLSSGASGTEIRAAIEGRISAAVSGGLRVQAEPARCETSVEIVAAAAAECDASVDPGELSFACEGSCEVEAGVQVDCGAEAELHCVVSAPSVECSGTCQGTCELNAGAQCEGTCKGGCEGTCSVQNADGTCNGQCNGTCTGSCELDVAASCDGQCQGSCDYVEPSGECGASAEAHCEAQAGGSVQCEAGCSGNADPPSVSAECEASVEAKASASVEWPSVPGTVRTSGVVEDSSSSGSRRSSSVTYHANVVYDYVVEGKAYQGERISYGSYGTGDEERATRIAAGYPEGAAVRVYFQPDDPGESVLEPGTEGVPWFFVAMGSA